MVYVPVIVYVVVKGTDYEDERIQGVFDNREDALSTVENQMMQDIKSDLYWEISTFEVGFTDKAYEKVETFRHPKEILKLKRLLNEQFDKEWDILNPPSMPRLRPNEINEVATEDEEETEL